MANLHKQLMHTDKEIVDYLSKSRLRASDVFAIPPIILKVDDSIIGTLGNFSSSTGKAKSRKTFNVSAITAASIINGKVLNYIASLPENKRMVVLIDTEQSKFHCKRVFNRILVLAGLEKNKQPDNFEFFSLRQYSPEIRILIIEKIIKSHTDIGIVIIDGIRDLAYDINSSHEATEVITKLMLWTDKYNIHIHTVLHQNKTDSNSRGHLGTELNNKSETVLKITVPEKQKEISIIESEFIRDRDFEAFAFSIDESGLPYLLDEFNPVVETTKRKRLDPSELPPETHINDILKPVFSYTDSLKYGKFIEEIRVVYQKYGGMGENKAKQWLQYYVNQGLVTKNESQYSLNNSY